MPALANMRHEWFCQEYVRSKKQTEAYRIVYCQLDKDGNFKGSPKAQWNNSKRLLKRPEVKARIQEIAMIIKRKSEISYEKVLNDYQRALDMAESLGRPGDMISAAREQARLTGLLVERQEFGKAGEFDMMENISDVIEKVKEEAGDEAASALVRAFNLLDNQKQEEAAAPQDTAALLEAEPGSDAVN